MIFTFRGRQVMIDSVLALLYKVSTKALNQAVRRNVAKFPKNFAFQLKQKEKSELVTNCDRLQSLKHSSHLPYAFTEQGVAMLSSVLKSDTAVKVSIKIIEAFVQMRKFLSENAEVFSRLDRVELKQLEQDKNFEKVFNLIQEKDIRPDKGIFFDGQVFDAHKFVVELVASAKYSITLIDNYIDTTVL
ncbi:MAG: ORF6N domain-containing protein [Candidatus Nanoarchaeia archaeon]